MGRKSFSPTHLNPSSHPKEERARMLSFWKGFAGVGGGGIPRVGELLETASWISLWSSLQLVLLLLTFALV